MFKFKKKFLVGLTAAFMSISMFSATASAAGTDYWQNWTDGAEQSTLSMDLAGITVLIGLIPEISLLVKAGLQARHLEQ